MRDFGNLLWKCVFVSSIFVSACRQDVQKESAIEVEDTWYRNALIYNLDVDVFKDSDGDGIGDFKGLSAKLGYLDTLGVDVIWLSPFQPTPDGDDGYDVEDYYGIDRRLGTPEDFRSFMEKAKAMGFKVIMDMVLNHTSIEHPWFKAARADTTSAYYDWYVWSKEKPKDWDKGMVFPGVQNETWSYDDITDAYYFHRFYNFQPDLNFEHPDVRKMAKEVLVYWLNQGMDGFRLDAVPFIIDKPKTGADDPEHMFEVLSDIAKAVKQVNPDAILLGEANVTAEENREYFGANGERLQMMFNFFANQYLFYSLAKQDPEPFGRALEDFKEKPASAQWAFFLRNHDEVDLARLSGRQRNLVFDKFGPESNMQLYERGIRRRLATMLGDTALIRMSYSLLFSLPGAPVLRYGEEIGMGDDLTLQERLSVRTPMQWNNTQQGGFSTAKKTIRPVISAGKYAYDQVNVASALKQDGSLLQFIRAMISLRKAHPEIGLGTWEILNPGSGKVLQIMYTHGNTRVLTLHNFSPQEELVKLDDELIRNHHLQRLTGQHDQMPPDKKGSIRLRGFGFAWFEIRNGQG